MVSLTPFGLTVMNTAIFNIIMLLVIFVNSIPFHLVLFLEPINMYVNIFGIVFATSKSRQCFSLRRRDDTDLSNCSLELGPCTCCKSDHLN
jgi:hypothetical protein